MKLIESFHSLMEIDNEASWKQELFRISNSLGFSHTLLAIVPKPGMKLEQAFLCSNYPSNWRKTYDQENMAYVDPTVAHCINRTTSLIWSPDIFISTKQKEMYEEASSYGLRSGLTLPIHGPHGELGTLCFVNDQPGKNFKRDLNHHLPVLSLLRDIIYDTGIDFALPPESFEPVPSLTPRELECLQWTASGKTSWETSKILGCSEATVNFHIANFRAKLEANTRREAVIKAIRLGIIALP